MDNFNYAKMDIPKFLIIGLGTEIKEFRDVVDYVTIPPIDTEICLGDIFYSMIISDEREFNRLITDQALLMCKGDGLYENPRLDEYEVDLVILALLKLSSRIKCELNRLRVFIDGHMPYSFYRTLGSDGVVLQFSSPDFD